MNGVANFVFCIFAYNAMGFDVAANGGRLTAVHSSAFARKLYRELRAQDTTHEADPASLDTQAQQHICGDILGSGFFDLPNLVTNELRKMYTRWHDQGSAESSRSLSSSRNSSPSSSVSWEREATLILAGEYSFTCVLADSPNYPYYVSAEYHVGGFDEPYMPGRFLFGNSIPGRRYSDQEIILAESPAVVHEEPGFNVELHYLQTRVGREPAKDNSSDPLCKLVSDWKRDPNNQHYRFCVAVSRSSDFKDKITYPRHLPFPCAETKVSFKTEGGMKGAADRIYYERMTICFSTLVDSNGGESFLYISRAYASNKVYVYSRDPADDKVYLENLSININIVDEMDHDTKN